ncbi:MAG: hypothetical protein ACLFQA_08950 [Bacteroidales bacterium]
MNPRRGYIARFNLVWETGGRYWRSFIKYRGLLVEIVGIYYFSQTNYPKRVKTFYIYRGFYYKIV